MSLRGVVENLEARPSSQVRAFWRETLGAAETMSVPVATFAKNLVPRAADTDLMILEPPRFTITDAITNFYKGSALNSMERKRNNIPILWALTGPFLKVGPVQLV